MLPFRYNLTVFEHVFLSVCLRCRLSTLQFTLGYLLCWIRIWIHCSNNNWWWHCLVTIWLTHYLNSVSSDIYSYIRIYILRIISEVFWIVYMFRQLRNDHVINDGKYIYPEARNRNLISTSYPHHIHVSRIVFLFIRNICNRIIIFINSYVNYTDLNARTQYTLS